MGSWVSFAGSQDPRVRSELVAQWSEGTGFRMEARGRVGSNPGGRDFVAFVAAWSMPFGVASVLSTVRVRVRILMILCNLGPPQKCDKMKVLQFPIIV